MYKLQLALTTASLVVSLSRADTVDLSYGFNDNFIACKGDDIRVSWRGEHNIQETRGSACYSGNIGDEIEGYLDIGDQRTYENNELSAAPGERRYFKCTYHCEAQASRFEVSCPPVNFGFDDNVQACEGDSVTVAWQGYHNIQETVGSACDSGDIGDEVEGYLEAGEQRTYSNNELSAAPGEKRYFKCNAHCGATANRIEVYCPAPPPTETPTSAPTEYVCVDDHTFRHQGKKKKSCRWIGMNIKRTKKLCKKKKVSDACKIVCGKCCADDLIRSFNVDGIARTCGWLWQETRQREQCTSKEVNSICAAKCGRCCINDKEFTFATGPVDDPKLRKCNWLKKKNRAKKWCKKEPSIAAACQKSCDSCEDYTIPITDSPTPSPTKSPTKAPVRSTGGGDDD